MADIDGRCVASSNNYFSVLHGLPKKPAHWQAECLTTVWGVVKNTPESRIRINTEGEKRSSMTFYLEKRQEYRAQRRSNRKQQKSD